MISVDVGNNAYAFGHYFECKPGQDVLMSGYLGSIGFGFPAAMGAWAATNGCAQGDRGHRRRRLRPVPGRVHDRGQVRDADHPRAPEQLANSARSAASRSSRIRPVWQTDLVNPDFAAYAESCGGRGIRVDTRDQLEPALREAMAVTDGPCLVEVRSSAQAV